MSSRTLAAALISATTLGACYAQLESVGGTGGGGSSEGGGGVTGQGFCAVQAIFAKSCGACHGPGSAQGGLDLITDPIGAMVDKPSAGFAGAVLIVPGDPDASLLYRKRINSQSGSEGGVMPPATEGLPTAEATVIRNWIADGAPGTCSDEPPPVERHHPEGFAEPTAHGLAANLQTERCIDCHGADLTGGDVGVSCDSCHQEGWRDNCTYCHGGADNITGAPPQDIHNDSDPSTSVFPGHTAHVTQGMIAAAMDCEQCHVKPDDALSPGHVFVGDTTPGAAEVTFQTSLSSQGTVTQDGCANLYCHGTGRGHDGSVSQTETMSCKSCHPGSTGGGWNAMSGEHNKHMNENVDCNDCHHATTTNDTSISGLGVHVNGNVEIDFGSNQITRTNNRCTGTCHGENHNQETW
ncbi:MAG: hypothetical protein KC731_01455 [Myxococcales bacterium]|nr:hypothetical protein [Myxococcales bacterium]